MGCFTSQEALHPVLSVVLPPRPCGYDPRCPAPQPTRLPVAWPSSSSSPSRPCRPATLQHNMKTKWIKKEKTTEMLPKRFIFTHGLSWNCGFHCVCKMSTNQAPTPAHTPCSKHRRPSQPPPCSRRHPASSGCQRNQWLRTCRASQPHDMQTIQMPPVVGCNIGLSGVCCLTSWFELDRVWHCDLNSSRCGNSLPRGWCWHTYMTMNHTRI